MKRLSLIAVSILTFSIGTNAQTPVWSTDIAPIFYNNCASCHRPSGIGSFELITYQDAVNKAASISSAVQTGYMPPWPPDPGYSRLAHERLLSKDEINKIKDWAANGTPQGDPNLAPPPPQFSNGGDLPGTPDLVTQIPNFSSTATTKDVYQCFVVPSQLAANRFMTAFEAIPGNRDIVHHVLVYADTTGICKQLDDNHPGPGYVSFGGPGTDQAIMLGGWVPGTVPMELPKNFGVEVPKNSDIVIQIHYPAGSAGKIDSTKIRFFFSSSPSLRSVRIDPVLNHAGVLCTMTPDADIDIPANQTKLYHQEFSAFAFVGDVTVLGVAPHMHLIGRSINCYGVKGTDTTKIIDIPKWDFSWQGFYLLRKLMKLPQGTTLHSDAFYDNTTNNPYNPSNPPQRVREGEATTDEMMVTYITWTQYQPGDENIVVDTSTPVSVKQPLTAYNEIELFTPYPNPSNNQLYLKYYLNKSADVSIKLIDVQGRLIANLVENKNTEKGYHVTPYSVADIPSGNYILELQTETNSIKKKITIQH